MNVTTFKDTAGVERLYYTKSVTIANGQSLSAAVDLEGRKIAGVFMPAAWTAANLTFQASDAAAGTYADVYDTAGTEISVTAAVSRALMDPSKLAGIRFLKIRSGTSAVPVNQLADRILILLLV